MSFKLSLNTADEDADYHPYRPKVVKVGRGDPQLCKIWGYVGVA
jgi:hypothetical protein